MSNTTIKAEDLAKHHIFTAKNGRKPTPAEGDVIDKIQDKARDLATLIFLDVPGNRNRALAITALEDAVIRSVRAIFEPDLPRL